MNMVCLSTTAVTLIASTAISRTYAGREEWKFDAPTKERPVKKCAQIKTANCLAVFTGKQRLFLSLVPECAVNAARTVRTDSSGVLEDELPDD
jgi:hypothetical protein